jgi:hypothetical protein
VAPKRVFEKELAAVKNRRNRPWKIGAALQVILLLDRYGDDADKNIESNGDRSSEVDIIFASQAKKTDKLIEKAEQTLELSEF